MLIKESELRKIIYHELFNNEFKINETFYYELNNRLLNESFMQDVKSKIGKLGIAGLTFLSLSTSALGNPTNNQISNNYNEQNPIQAQIASNAEEMAIIQIMLRRNCSREQAKIIHDKTQAFLAGQEDYTDEQENIFDVIKKPSKLKTKVNQEAKADMLKAHENMMNSYREQQEEIRSNNKNIENNPFTVLNDPNISHEDSRYVFASASFNAIIDKFLLDSAADLESGNLEQVNNATERAKNASSLKFSGEFKNEKELQTYLRTGSLPSK